MAMRVLFVSAGLLATPAHAGQQGTVAQQQALEKAWGSELSAPGKSPVQRVVMLLKKMKSELEEEASKESEMYDKMVCWCETNEKEKTKAIADADAKDLELTAEIEARSARFGKLSAEIDNTKKGIAENTASLQQELADQASFKELSAAKSAEIEAGKTKLDEMQAEDAGNAKALSDAKEDLALTREQRSADVKFLQNLKLQCNDLDAQWEKRSQTRAAETKAVAEALVILTEDDNRETLHRSVSLLQEESSSGAARRRSAAVAYLRRASGSPDFEAEDLLSAWRGRGSASRSGGPRARLSTLAMAVQLDSFAKVKEMIDKMHAELKQQQAEEVKFKAYCEKELNENEKTVYEKTELKKDLEAKIAQLESLIKKLHEEIEEAKKQIAETEVEIKKSSQTREAENAEFQKVVADQRATQSILAKALQKLKDFYVKNMGSKVALAQQTPPVQFNNYKNNEGASPVMGLIEQIVEDSKQLEAETTSGESQAQADYEKFVKEANALIADLGEQVTSKTKAIAAADGDKAQASADLENTEGELESLAAYEADLHGQCDFVLKNFDIRQKARMQEMEAIMSAKAILSGDLAAGR